MGDTYFIKNIECVYCKNDNNFIEEASMFGNPGLPFTFEFGSEFVCEDCKKKNQIVMKFVAIKPEI